MKKLILIFIIGLCAFPVFAQEGKIIKGALDGGAALTDAVTREVAKQTLTGPQIRLAQITNLPGQPTVKIKQQEFVPSNPLSARILPGNELRNVLYPKSGTTYLPKYFTGRTPDLFRGMGLQKISDLEDILTKGLEIKKTQHTQIYFSADVTLALSYSKFVDDVLPVLVRIRATPQLLNKNYIYRKEETDMYVSICDIPAHFLTDVVMFLEVNGKAGWYKAVLVNAELVLVPETSFLFNDKSIIRSSVGKFEFPFLDLPNSEYPDEY